jgi:ATP-dependent 26S proteasome regulatory subunit
MAMPVLSPPSRHTVLQHVLTSLLPRDVMERNGPEMIRGASDSSPGFSVADVLALGHTIADHVLLSRAPARAGDEASVADISNSLASLKLGTATDDDLQPLIASAVAHTRPSILRALSSTGAPTRCQLPVCAGIDKQLAEISAVLKSVFSQDSALFNQRLRPCSGLLLCGPSGCGKSVVAKWIAASMAASANFITIEAPAILSAVVGDSEKALSSAFDRARASAPSVLFIDKLEVLGRVRGQDSTTEGTYDRLLATLLVEMDGLKQGASAGRTDQPVFFLASTEDAAVIDGALLRPGRFEHIVLLHPPDAQQRAEVFRAILDKMAYSGDLERDVQSFAQMTDGCSMALIASVCVGAALSALRANPQTENFTASHVKAEISGD